MLLQILDEKDKHELRHYFNSSFGGVTRVPFDKYLSDTLSIRRAGEQLKLLAQITGSSLKGLKILEIGSGCGAFQVAASLEGMQTTGIEPDPVCAKIAAKVISSIGYRPGESLIQAQGESLPWPDCSFDIVYSSNVLEHVANPELVIKEAVRVAKVGGFIQFVVPNYGSFWEGHYGIPWIPNLPKMAAGLYVNMLGRKSSFINTLNLITLRRMQRIAGCLKGRIQIMDWGWTTWESRLQGLEFSEWADLGKLKRWLKMFRKSGLMPFSIKAGKLLGWVSPIIFTAKKIN